MSTSDLSNLRIGISTGGGDCPGLNAVLYGVVRRAHELGLPPVVGIRDGFDGLMDLPRGARELSLAQVESVWDRGGTLLGTTNRGNPFSEARGHSYANEVLSGAQKLGLSHTIVVGGDGTLTIAARLGQMGLPVIGVPKTIDGDVWQTEETIGFTSAVQEVADALDRLRATAASHHRVMVLEVMGRDSGALALHGGLAGGADVILLPEIPYTANAVAERLREVTSRRSMGYALVVVAEGVSTKLAPKAMKGGRGTAQALADELAPQLPDLELRVVVLSHLQRGGAPVAHDRLLGLQLGLEAVNAAVRGEQHVVIVSNPPQIHTAPLDQVARGAKLLDKASPLLTRARELGICLG